MIEPVSVSDLLLAVIAGALVVTCGALYALLFALARMGPRPSALIWAYGAYLGLVISAAVLARAIHLDGPWLLAAAVVLLGYLLAPHGIWRLCLATHEAGPTTGPAAAGRRAP